MKEAGRAKEFVSYLKEREIYVKGPWSAPRDKYITITIGPATLMDRFVQETKAFLEKR
jgi:histidinol-phosphate/aromatic aminotransferase/cobyric acid decarboxylase-like protein